jgi:Protein of unknown function (DUF3168)
MIGPLADLRTAILAKLASDTGLLALVPAGRHFGAVPRHAAEPWIALGSAHVFDNGSSQSFGHRVEMQVHIVVRPKQPDVSSEIASRVTAAATSLRGPAGATHIVDVQVKQQVFETPADETSVRLALTLIAITEPL